MRLVPTSSIMLTLDCLATALAVPALFGRLALRRGYSAFERKHYGTARRYFERAARHEHLREEAICLLAESALQEFRPAEALYSLNALLVEQDQLSRDHPTATPPRRSARVRLLRGIAGCILGRASAARRELAAISKSEATVDELLAAAQACILSEDFGGAQLLFEKLDAHPVAGPLAARIRLCKASHYFRLKAWEKCWEALPHEADCSPPDRIVCLRVRDILFQKLAPARHSTPVYSPA